MVSVKTHEPGASHFGVECSDVVERGTYVTVALSGLASLRIAQPSATGDTS